MGRLGALEANECTLKMVGTLEQFSGNLTVGRASFVLHVLRMILSAVGPLSYPSLEKEAGAAQKIESIASVSLRKGRCIHDRYDQDIERGIVFAPKGITPRSKVQRFVLESHWVTLPKRLSHSNISDVLLQHVDKSLSFELSS